MFKICTEGTLQELVNNNPDAWRSERSAAPDNFYVAPNAQEALDSVNRGGDQSEETARAKFVLPKVDFPIEPEGVVAEVVEESNPVRLPLRRSARLLQRCRIRASWPRNLSPRTSPRATATATDFRRQIPQDH